MRSTLVALGSASLAFATLPGCAAHDPGQRLADAPMSRTVSPETAAYAQFASSAELFEIQAGQLALQRSQNPAVRSIAQTLVGDHLQLSSELALAAQSAGVSQSAPSLSPVHSGLYAQLQSAGPQDFDTTYRNVELMTHMQAYDAHQRFIVSTDAGPFRNFAQNAMMTTQMRMNQFQSLNIAPPSYRAPSHRRAGERG